MNPDERRRAMLTGPLLPTILSLAAPNVVNVTVQSLVRDMHTPGVALITLAILQIPLSGALTLGWLGLPQLGVAGPAAAAVISYAIAALWILQPILQGRAAVRLRWPTRGFHWDAFADILKVGGTSCVVVVLINGAVLAVTGLIARAGDAAIAGYGVGSRLEYLLSPLTFGIGAALTALVGTNKGARQFARARRAAWLGASISALSARPMACSASRWRSTLPPWVRATWCGRPWLRSADSPSWSAAA